MTDPLVSHGLFLCVILAVGLVTATVGAIREGVLWALEPRHIIPPAVVPHLSRRQVRAARAASRAVQVVPTGRGRTLVLRTVKQIPLVVPPVTPVLEVVGLTAREERRLEMNQ